MKWTKKNVISISDFSKDEIEFVLKKSAVMEKLLKKGKAHGLMKGKILASLFFEPSTRTRLSFNTAILRLGGNYVGFTGPEGTSVEKGETIIDTARMASGYADMIVVRSKIEGSAQLITEYVDVPVINAGDGAHKHPSQTLLDLYTIKKDFGGIDGLKMCLVGDLKYSRTIHSLIEALKLYDVELRFISPPELRMPTYMTKDLLDVGLKVKETEKLDLKDSDVVYATRIQKERFPDPREYEKVKDVYVLDKDILKDLKGSAIIMHPLPRVTEISSELDGTKHARYFEQAWNGIPVRMTLLCLISGVRFG